MSSASRQDPSSPGTRHRPRRRAGLLVTLILGVPIALLLVWPQGLHAERLPLVAQVISFRAGLAIALLAGAGVFALAAVARRRWSIAAGLAVVLLAASLGNAGVLLARGSAATAAASEAEGDMTVLAWNTQGGAASPESIARLVIETDADIVSLPETDEQAVGEVARLVALEGRTMVPDTTWGLDGESDIPTSVLISDELGEYRLDPEAGSTPGLPSGVWMPVDGSGPRFVAAHPLPPLPGLSGRWNAGLGWVTDHCSEPEVIVAGDLNATVDHLASALDGCQDAASESQSAAVGTWPATAPAWLAAPIDHVLVGSAWEVRAASVVTGYDTAGSDHRPIVAVVARR
ncbi:endonuclease/exonuclease/phosphatase family protein [Microbacterium sp. W4I20]|uniref:endonuclease/exonuclease/phosphatase family protein n=1 Tax=Microbacterium sp. W4I20 TaxID=3042262 RepID=UPI00278286F1|nr:endonuclease/exonuclease/phosphatase family protein [Microbacterium sp. W4I20]MDQ0728921.1 endonuclease/exonuclease/phosphatase (EEP) superfamily protein YafD [Microbacterium sp. W4I20]